MRIAFILKTVCLCLLFSSVGIAKEPINLALHKEALKHYHDKQYSSDISAAIAQARDYLKQHLDTHAHLGKKPAIILDIDETSLSNYQDLVKNDFGGTLEEIRAMEDKGEDPVILPTLMLYQFAQRHQVAIFFITGRFEKERDVTALNLKKAGYTHWDGLILRSGEFETKLALEYKTAMRKKITEEGYHIVLNVGDQESDLQGGFADKTIKLPNPYYYIR